MANSAMSAEALIATLPGLCVRSYPGTIFAEEITISCPQVHAE